MSGQTTVEQGRATIDQRTAVHGLAMNVGHAQTWAARAVQ